MKIFVIYTLDEDLMHAPIATKIDEHANSIVAFQHEQNANLYIKNVLASGKYEVKELTFDAFDALRNATKKHLGADTLIRILD